MILSSEAHQSAFVDVTVASRAMVHKNVTGGRYVVTLGSWMSWVEGLHLKFIYIYIFTVNLAKDNQDAYSCLLHVPLLANVITIRHSNSLNKSATNLSPSLLPMAILLLLCKKTTTVSIRLKEIYRIAGIGVVGLRKYSHPAYLPILSTCWSSGYPQYHLYS